MNAKIIALRMERQCFTKQADEDEYIKLYRDMQPIQIEAIRIVNYGNMPQRFMGKDL